ncbi:MAG: trehalose-phosphatase [Candidatus Omnitrophica bacterium]|nr:trehalose-phosphatase [Candidatus Omnitrophota bacterium]
MKYLFNEWDIIKNKIKDKYLFIFLDFDGTLTPITDTPDKAQLSKKTKALLEEIAGNSRIKLAFISGRAIGDIKNKIGLKNAIYAGNHGLEIEGPRMKFKPLVPAGFRKILKKIKDNLKTNTASFRGVLIEDKGSSLSLHYRLVDRSKIPQIKRIFHQTVISYLASNKIKIKSGKMVLETRPPIEWDKGRAVLRLLIRQIFVSGKDNVLPIYIGDDIADEDAFKVLKNKGLTVFVGAPKKSYAQYYLKDPKEAIHFLRSLPAI